MRIYDKCVAIYGHLHQERTAVTTSACNATATALACAEEPPCDWRTVTA
jgi:hypothetical protein